MSGIVGIFRRDGAPIEPGLLRALVDFLGYRGPDARASWLKTSIGLGHSLLCTTRESSGERQPISLNERYILVADARLDCRAELITELQPAKHALSPNAPDCELILHAYATWGPACVDHLRGDFSFAIWDMAHNRLFCARDHFGIKPFYYANVGDLFLFSNTLNCIRMHPQVSAELNEVAIGDFLLFGLNYDNATTTFRDIQRLPPAHSLTVETRGIGMRRYWSPPTDGRIRYANPEEYVEHFKSLFQPAIGDRLRLDRVGILLSGGLDSSSVAAVAKGISNKGSETEIRAYTHVFKSLISDEEGDYAGEVGEFLHIPVKCIEVSGAQLFERWDDPDLSLPEPVEAPFLARSLGAYRDVSMDCRVLLSGEGSDNLMDFQFWPYARDLVVRKDWTRLLTDVSNYFWIRPFPWRGIQSRAQRLVGKAVDQPIYPGWVAPEFCRRTNLKDRWKEKVEVFKSWVAHPIHPRGHGSLALPQWTHMFEQNNPGVTRYPVETRYPFLDLRIVNYLLALPPFPWFYRKHLLREAMTGQIPERVRTRPKTPLEGDPVSAELRRTGTAQLKMVSWIKDLDRYVERTALPLPNANMNEEQLSMSLRPYFLNIWLHSLRMMRYGLPVKTRND